MKILNVEQFYSQLKAFPILSISDSLIRSCSQFWVWKSFWVSVLWTDQWLGCKKRVENDCRAGSVESVRIWIVVTRDDWVTLMSIIMSIIMSLGRGDQSCYRNILESVRLALHARHGNRGARPLLLRRVHGDGLLLHRRGFVEDDGSLGDSYRCYHQLENIGYQ